MKIVDEREMQKTTATTTTTTKRWKGARETEAIVKGWELNDFVVHLS